VLLNSAAALLAADRASTLREGLELARESIASGAARARMERMVATSRA
jgi:anthranilate phosphoribosyltransferase